METLRGISVSPGVAIGEAVILDAEDYRIPYRSVTDAEVERELETLDRAFDVAVTEVQKQTQQLRSNLGRDVADVIGWHVGVLKDEQLKKSIEDLIKEKQASAAYATSTVMRTYQSRFRQMQDPLLAERIKDVRDIERRLLRNILGETREDLAHLSKPVILIAHDLAPTLTAQLSGTKVVGVAMDAGAATSHTAILLRSWGHPGVVGLNDVSTRVGGGETVIVDGTNQLIIADPTEEVLEEYREKQLAFGRLSAELDELRELPAVTTDDERIFLLSNIEFPEEASAGMEKGSDGVGLYRTEFLFLRPESSPDEEEQYEAYTKAIQGVNGRAVTIRTFDLGADKYTQRQNYTEERNPMLGLRSIRYSLQNLDIFKVQLRALLRASVHGQVRIMFPLVSSLMEFRQAKMTIHDALEDLEEEGIKIADTVPIGMMLETPAAAIQVKDFCREVDFISIGTNDLVQYLLAVDRGNERVSQHYTPSHPAVLRSLRDVVRTCRRAGVECSICGEMAGEPLYTMFLIGLGLRHLSMAPGHIPEVKKLIRLTSLAKSELVARRVMTFDTAGQVTNYLRDKTRKVLPEDPI